MADNFKQRMHLSKEKNDRHMAEKKAYNQLPPEEKAEARQEAFDKRQAKRLAKIEEIDDEEK